MNMAATPSKSKLASRFEAARLSVLVVASAYNWSCDGKAKLPQTSAQCTSVPLSQLPAGPSLQRVSESRFAEMPELRAFLFPRVRLLPRRHDHHVHPHCLYRARRVCSIFGASRSTALARKLHLCILGGPRNFSRHRSDASRVQLMAVTRFLDRSVAAWRTQIICRDPLRTQLGAHLGDRLAFPKLLPILRGAEGTAVHAIDI